MGMYDDACKHKVDPAPVKSRKCYRLEKKEIDFLKIRTGDLFILEDSDREIEDGTTINGAESFAAEVDGVPTVQCSQVGKTEVPDIKPIEALPWVEDCRQQMRNVEYFKGERDMLLKMIFGAPSLVELQLELKEKGYDKLIEDDVPPEMVAGGPPTPLVEDKGLVQQFIDDWNPRVPKED